MKQREVRHIRNLPVKRSDLPGGEDGYAFNNLLQADSGQTLSGLVFIISAVPIWGSVFYISWSDFQL